MRWARLAALFVIVILVAGCSRSSSTGDVPASPASVATPEQQSVESAKSSIELIKAQDYSASYRALASADRDKVTEQEWVHRCQEVEAIAGRVDTYRVIGSRWLDERKTIRAVDVEVGFSKLEEPVMSTLFYVIEDGSPIETMLWGREIELAGDGQ